MNAMPSVGDDFGRYRIVRELGRGGMGVVFLARDESLERDVALKIIAPQWGQEDDYRARFKREALALSRVDSPHVVAVHDHGEHDGHLFLVTQLVPDGDLFAYVREHGSVSPSVILDLVEQVLDGLADAHRAGVVHRDVKPSNVLVRRRGGRLEAVLCDFGIATTPDGEVTRTGGVVGSFPWMAPERHQGEAADAQGDVYSVGCLLWWLLTGAAPYGGSDMEVALGHVQAAIPQLANATDFERTLNAVLLRSLAKQPTDRYASARAMAADVAVARAVAPESVALPDVTQVRHALVTPAGPAAAPAGRRRPLVAALAVAAAVVLVVGVGVGVRAVSPPPDEQADDVPAAFVDTSSAPAPEAPTSSANDPESGAGAKQKDTGSKQGDKGKQGKNRGNGSPSTVPGTDDEAPQAPQPSNPGNQGSGQQNGSSGKNNGGNNGQNQGNNSGQNQGNNNGAGNNGNNGNNNGNGGGKNHDKPSQDPTPTPDPWSCWNGTTAATYNACGLPTGYQGLRWMYPGISSVSGCYQKANSGGGRLYGITCNMVTPSGRGTVDLVQWTSVKANNTYFNSISSTRGQPWNGDWGRRWTYFKKGWEMPARQANSYRIRPFSLRVQSTTVNGRTEMISRIAPRPPSQLRGVPR